MANKKKPVKSKQELIDKYNELKKQKNSWWNVLAYEQNSIKTIVGGFILYIGYLIVANINVAALLLVYCVVVIGVIWYWIDMLRTEYEQQRKAYKQQMRVLSGEIRKWSKKKVVAAHPSLRIVEQRRFHIAQSMLPYIWGFSPESIQQFDHYEQGGISMSSIEIKEEKAVKEYWLFAAPTKLKFGGESTAILPKPFRHDKWPRVRFNSEIERPDFQADFSIFSSEFMHSYYLISRQLIDRFLALPTEDKWLVFRKNIAYLLLPKKSVLYDVNRLDETQKMVNEEAEEGLRLLAAFRGLV